MLKLKVTVAAEDSGRRLDTVLTALLLHHPETSANGLTISRSKVDRWIADGRVELNGRPVSRPSAAVSTGAIFEVSIPIEAPLHLSPSQNVPFSILFEDDHLLVINKPAGIVVHPGAGRRDDTLVNGLVHYLGPALPRIGDALRPGIVHRLDKDTSGVMVVAKSETAYHSLVEQFKPPRTIERLYLAAALRLPEQAPGSPRGVIELPIGRHATQRTKMAVNLKGKTARTSWRSVEIFKFGVLLELKIETGRTHQIRVHLAATKAPVLGDPVYGPNLTEIPPAIRPAIKALGRQALHAFRLSFIHPASGEKVDFTAPPPEDIERLIAVLRRG